MNYARLFLRVGAALVVRPWLWPETVRMGVRFKPTHGLLPPAAYRKFREECYGMPVTKMPTADIIGYITWCRRFPR